MFEIGNTLRQARERKGLSLADVERDLNIRPRYLAALEEERFDALPGEAYVKGFLRTYAEYLGLDARLFLDEYKARTQEREEPVVFTPPPRFPPLQLEARPRTIAVLAAAVLVPVVLGLAAWRLTSSGGAPSAGSAARVTVPAASTETRQSAAGATAAASRPPRPRRVHLVLEAARGDSWVLARAGSETGRVLYEATLPSGESIRLHGRRLWLRLGAPWNLDARLNGRPIALPGEVASVLVSPRGIRLVG